MNKEELLISGLRDLYQKTVFINNAKMRNSLKGYTSSEVHCIETIGMNPDSNVTKLAESFYMTLGAISKLTKKLIQKGLIESYRKPDNKKEIYFRLTGQGEAVFKVHDELHQQFRERDKEIFEQVTGEQMDTILGFVERYNRHLDAEIRKQGVKITSPDNIEF